MVDYPTAVIVEHFNSGCRVKKKKDKKNNNSTQFSYFASPDDLRRNYSEWIYRPIVLVSPDHSHALHHAHPMLHASEYRMLLVQPRRWRQRDEKLAAIRIRPGVGHAQDAGASVSQRRVDFVFELFAVDGGPAASCAGGIAALDHEVGNDAVEDDVVVVSAAGERCEVYAGLVEPALARYKHKQACECRNSEACLGRMLVVELNGYLTLYVRGMESDQYEFFRTAMTLVEYGLPLTC